MSAELLKKFYCTSSTYNSASMITASKARINGSFLKNIFFNIFDFLFEIRALCFKKTSANYFIFWADFRILCALGNCRSGSAVRGRSLSLESSTQLYILLTLKARKRPSKATHSMLSSLDFPENGAFRSIMFH